MAMRITGDFRGDDFTLFFDPRSPEELGTAGPYFWSNLEFGQDGIFHRQSGETSDNRSDLRGVWRETATGASAELLIPFRWMRLERFPASGQLGFSLVWRHRGADGKMTTLNWAESGHPWTPYGYGVISRQESPDLHSLPYCIRIE